MDIGIIGRLGHSEAAFRDLASALGHDAFFHDRIIDGDRPEALARFIDRCSMVVIALDVTSVALVRLASEHMKKRLRSPLLLHRHDLGRFTNLVSALAVDGRDSRESAPRLRTGTGTR
jgi:hypothetical protein